MKHRESELQIACVKWFRLAYPQYAMLLFAIKNEGKSSKFAGKIANDMGRNAGTADMFLSKPNHINGRWSFGSCYYWNGLYIEFKVEPNKQTFEQIAFQCVVETHGYKYAVIYSVDEFMELIKEYLG